MVFYQKGKNNKMEYQITLNDAQVKTLITATEIYLRMGLAQFNYAIDLGFNVPEDKLQEVHDICNALKFQCTGMPPNQSYGIGCKELSEGHNTAHDLNQVLKHRIAWDEKPTGGHGVNFYKPFKISKHPLAKIKRISSTLTVDGWSTEKPSTPGLYKVRLADEHNSIINTFRIKKVKGVLLAYNMALPGSSILLSDLNENIHWRKVKKL
jgi:hypothetical protein